MDKIINQKETAWLFDNLYKYNGKNMELSQQQRREKFLEEQKQKRHKITDKHRQLCETFFKEIDLTEDMECDTEKSPKKNPNFKLMESEWFTDIPSDLEDNWFVKFCPRGFRILLIARNRTTIGYNNQGKKIFKIRSKFPGGGENNPNGITVLDCIYNNSVKTIFVLDGLFWNSMSMLESEVNFRFFWLKNKFEEDPTLVKCIKYNFILLDFVPAQRPLIQDHMFTLMPIANQKLPYDGVTFYHKESHYIFGYTPLVGWLASYMLPEKLQIDVSAENLVKKPKDYINMEHYLTVLRHRKKRNKEKNQVDLESEMDIQ